MHQQSSVPRTTAKFNAEISQKVPAELATLVSSVGGELKRDTAFLRGYEMFHRLMAGEKDALVRAKAESDFALFAGAHLLKLAGREVSEVVAQLGSTRVIPWITKGQVPEVLCDNDPLRGALFTKRVVVPVGASADFAYVLGAHAGTRRLGTSSIPIAFTSAEGKLVDRVIEACERSCSLRLGRYEAMRDEFLRVTASSHAREFVDYLHAATGGNARVPWKHVQTSAERCEFIRGFLDFAGGTFDVAHHRLIIGRRHNAGLLEEVALVLKREGIIARLSSGVIPSLHIESYQALEALRDRHLVNSDRLIGCLTASLAEPPAAQTGRPEHYHAVMEMADRLSRRGRVSPDELRQHLRRSGDPAGELSLDTIRQWVRHGHVPVSVVRLKELENLEGRLFSGARLSEIGHAVCARAGSLHPFVTIQAIAEFWGGVANLAARCGVPARILSDFTTRSRLPSRAEYRLVLGAVGLTLSGELEEASVSPEYRHVEGWLKSDGERKVFGSYSASLYMLARDAFARGDDPREAVRARLARLMKRNAEMIRDTSV